MGDIVGREGFCLAATTLRWPEEPSLLPVFPWEAVVLLNLIAFALGGLFLAFRDPDLFKVDVTARVERSACGCMLDL